jgi:hypothetical protein
MAYYDEQKDRNKRVVLQYLNDPGKGTLRSEFPYGNLIKNIQVPHFLYDSETNLFDDIKESAQKYFESNSIKWWKVDMEDNKKRGYYLVEDTSENMPTRNLLSSQVSCLNHLFFLRKRDDLVTAILKNIDSRITQALVVDDGFVEFEVMEGKKLKNPLMEKESHYDEARRKLIKRKRGEFSTSVDAVMIGETKDRNILFLIEWKYTEFYTKGYLIRTSNSKKYNEILQNKEKSPINVDNLEKLYYEPYYQLMRQTLLGCKMVEEHEYDCTDYIHLHIVPKCNNELLSTINSQRLAGKDMVSTWKNVLVNPEKYITLSPEEFFKPLENEKDAQELIKYLKLRYWE